MTAPFAPELLTPKNRGASASASVTLTWKFKSVAAGDYMKDFTIRRRQMTPTVGAYEYWTGAAWGAETWLAGPTAPNLVKDGMTGTITITTGWTTDRVYQWSVKVRNLATEASTYAEDNLIQIHAAPAMAISVSSTVISRPKISWVWSGAAGFYMRSYRVMIYSAAVQGASGFDASSAVWQALATYDSGTQYSSTAYQTQIKADLASGTTYYVYYKTEDNSELSSGWVNATNFSPTYTAVPPPTIVAVPNPNTGVVQVTVRSSFNLLGDDLSIFTAGIGTWAGSLNCGASWNSGSGKLQLKVGGMTYAQLDAAHTTYTATDTAYTTFENMRTTMAAPSGTSRALSGASNAERVAVTAGVAYSAIATLTNNAAASRTAKLGIRWHQAGGAASAITAINQGAGTACPSGVATGVKVENVTAPADAAFAAIEIEWTTSVIDDIVLVDDVAMASATTISWSPSGGAFDISFVLEHSSDGVTWDSVWGCSQDSPHVSDSGAVSQVIVDDRSCPLSVQTLYYRAYAVSNFSTSPIWSALATTSVAGMKPETWWLRRPEQTTAYDIKIAAVEFSRDMQLNRELFSPEGASYPVVSYGSAPDVEFVNISIMTKDPITHDAVMDAIRSPETLFIHSNLENEQGYYVRPVDSVKRTQRRAAASNAYSAVRHLNTVSFTAAIVEKPV